jgi:hypothetical protein
MEDGTLSLGRRISAAFWLQYNLIMLFGCACFSLALSSFGPLRLGLIVELLWLAVAIGLPKVCAWVLERSTETDDQLSHAGLPPELCQRIRALRQSAGAIIRAAKKARELTPLEQRSLIERVNAIQHAFVRLARSAHQISVSLIRQPTSEIAAEMQRLREASLGEKDLVVKLGLKQALGLLSRRLQERERVLASLRATEVQMRTIDTSLAYMRSLLDQGTSPAACAAELESLAQQLAACEALEADTGKWLTKTGTALVAPQFRS